MPGKKQRIRDGAFRVPEVAVEELRDTRERLERTRAEFLKVDLQTALTFTGIALRTTSGEKKQRNLRAARKAYDSIGRLLQKTELEEAEAHELNRDLQRLRAELIDLGEAL